MIATANSYGLSSQKGAALIVSMVMLLVITAIGVAVMSGSHLELLMSNNSQLQSSSYLNAEYVLKEGESTLPSPPPTPASSNSLTPDPRNIVNWTNNAITPAPTPVTLGGGVIGSYAIEHLGYNVYSTPNPGNYKDSTSACTPSDTCVDVYRIWAYGTDAKGAKTLLQKTVVLSNDVSLNQASNTVEMP